jgi:hypothetical protein
MSDKKVDPTGKQALFSAAAAEAPDRSAAGGPKGGKEALFSTPPRRPGTAVIECSVCRVRQRATWIEVWSRLALLSIWFPLQRYPHWMSCPTCGRRQWCRVGWTE